jgi:hypothetical protein
LRNKNKESYSLKFLKPGNQNNTIDSEFSGLLREAIENQLSIIPSDFKVLVNCCPIRNTDNIIALYKMFIDELGFKALGILNSSSLSLFSTGRTSGLVVECGEHRSYTVPVYEGFPLYHALNKNHIGGKDITNIVSEGIMETGHDLRADIINLRKIKEKTCHVPHLKSFEDYMEGEDPIPPERRLYKVLDTDLHPEKRIYKTPDDQIIIQVPKTTRLLASELLFKYLLLMISPSLQGRSDKGLVSLIADSIKKSSIDNDDLRKV